MSYRILIDPRAGRQLESLPRAIIPKIDEAILALAEDPRPPGVKRLRGKLQTGWRIRVGRYRVLYRIDDSVQEVQIFEVGHRREVYR